MMSPTAKRKKDNSMRTRSNSFSFEITAPICTSDTVQESIALSPLPLVTVDLDASSSTSSLTTPSILESSRSDLKATPWQHVYSKCVPTSTSRRLNVARIHSVPTDIDQLDSLPNNIDGNNSGGDQEIQKELASRMPDDDFVYKKHINEFRRAYDGSVTYRQQKARKNEACGVITEESMLASSDVVAEIEKRCDAKSTRKVHLISLQSPSIDKCAQASCYFLAYCRLAFSQLEKATTGQILDFAQNEKENDRLDELIVNFYSWYKSFPVTRTSGAKVLNSYGDVERSLCKESVTMRTVMKGLLTFLMISGIIPQSSPRATDDMSKKLWNAIRSRERGFVSNESGGNIKLEKLSLSMQDIVSLMLLTDGAENEVVIQSWLFALFLVGSGLRPGSVKTSVNRDERGSKNISADLNNNTREVTCDDTDVDNDQSRCESDEEDSDAVFNLDFNGLRAGDVNVYRTIRQEDDPPNSSRLFVELRIRKDKLTGNKIFNAPVHGFRFPTTNADGGTDWSPNAALAIALLCVSAGIVNPEDLYCKSKEPSGRQNVLISDPKSIANHNPLFRKPGPAKTRVLSTEPLKYDNSTLQYLCSSLKIPKGAYSSKSLRCGYADSVLTDAVARKDPDHIINNEEIKAVLQSSARWRSDQAQVYIRHTVANTVRLGRTISGHTAKEWLSARYDCMAYSRVRSKDYKFYNARTAINEFEKRLIAKGQTPDEARKYCGTLKQRERELLAWTMTYESFTEVEPEQATDMEIRNFFTVRPVVDLKRTVELYTRSMGIDDSSQPFSDIIGNYYSGMNGPYICPRKECKKAFSTASQANQHWKTHLSSLTSSMYCCPCKGDNSDFNLKAFRLHIRTFHRKCENEKFQWILVDRRDSGTDENAQIRTSITTKEVKQKQPPEALPESPVPSLPISVEPTQSSCYIDPQSGQLVFLMSQEQSQLSTNSQSQSTHMDISSFQADDVQLSQRSTRSKRSRCDGNASDEDIFSVDEYDPDEANHSKFGDNCRRRKSKRVRKELDLPTSNDEEDLYIF